MRHLENESELEIVNNNNVDSLAENENEIAETNNHEWQDSERASYTLPPRTTRGVPPKRYDPDYEAQQSRYPVGTSDRENMSQSALAFNAALYSTKLPDIVEEALATDHWRKAMEEEICPQEEWHLGKMWLTKYKKDR